jgi:putative ABC transport system substrate-binding protein
LWFDGLQALIDLINALHWRCLWRGTCDGGSSWLSLPRKESGYVEGQNVAIQYRWADGDLDRLPALAADLVNRKITVIATVGGTVSALAAKAATAAVPIVFISDQDPVKVGLVKNLNRPDGNATGVSQLTSELEAKRLALLRELIPSARRIAILINPSYPDAETQVKQAQDAAVALGEELFVLKPPMLAISSPHLPS